MRLLRDRALLLLGFWRAFRSDELVQLRVEHLSIEAGAGMRCFLPQSKGDRNYAGRSYPVPSLSRWCPVTATHDWVAASRLVQGPLFPRIDRYGHRADAPMHPNSVIGVLRRLLGRAGIPTPESFSGHSLRRGFAGWANANGWDIKSLMDYVGWKSVQSAMRYIDSDPTWRTRMESGLPTILEVPPRALLLQSQAGESESADTVVAPYIRRVEALKKKS